jgi:hypothetical protein
MINTIVEIAKIARKIENRVVFFFAFLILSSRMVLFLNSNMFPPYSKNRGLASPIIFKYTITEPS